MPALQERGAPNNGKAKICIDVERYKVGNPRDLTYWSVLGKVGQSFSVYLDYFYCLAKQPFLEGQQSWRSPLVKGKEH